MAENDDQLVYIKRFVNKQYANRIEWLYSVLAETIRHTDNLEVRRLLAEVKCGHFYHAWYKFTHYFYPPVSAETDIDREVFCLFPMNPKESVDQMLIAMSIYNGTTRILGKLS